MELIMLLGFIAVIALPSIIWLYALADASINTFTSFGVKIIWLLLLSFFPPIGTLFYFLIGRGQRRTYYPVGRLVLICILIFPMVATIAYYLNSPKMKTYIEDPPSKTIQI